MPPSARKRAGSSTATTFLGDSSVTAPPPLDVTSAPRSGASVIANKSGLPAALLADGGSPTGYSPLYTPTRDYFEGRFEGAARLPAWVWWWMVVSAALVLIDSSYVLGQLGGGLARALPPLPGFLARLWTWYGDSDTQYSAKSLAANSSSGWIPTQSKFNLLEVAAQLAYLLVLRKDGAQALLAALVAQVCTLYKTLIYMSMIWHAADPVAMVPLLSCVGMHAADAAAEADVAAKLAREGCATQLFKFQFNFWWIVVPLCVIWACWHRAAVALGK